MASRKSQPNIHAFSSYLTEIQAKRCFALQVKCPSLLTDRNQRDVISSAGM